MLKNLFLLLFLLNFCTVIGQDKDLLEDISPDLFDSDFRTYDRKTAIYCAQLSEVAYWDSLKIDRLYKEVDKRYPKMNHHYDFIEYTDKKNDTQVLLWGNNKFLIISFRGTEPTRLKDWFSDSKFWNYENLPSAQISLANMPAGHGGFRTSLIRLIQDKDLFKRIGNIISKLNPEVNINSFPIYLTGHSLGAGISQLFIEPLDFKGFNFSGAYHFAPPLAVTCELKEYMESKYKEKVFDIVNYKDYVPRAGRNNTAHFGKFHRICKDGLIYKEEEFFIKFRFWEHFKQVKWHSLSSHLTAVKKNENNHANIENRSANANACITPRKRIKPCGSQPNN